MFLIYTILHFSARTRLEVADSYQTPISVIVKVDLLLTEKVMSSKIPGLVVTVTRPISLIGNDFAIEVALDCNVDLSSHIDCIICSNESSTTCRSNNWVGNESACGITRAKCYY